MPKELTDLKNESTLANIAEAPEINPHYLLFAVIIDISEPYKSVNSSNWTTKLKVIDPSFNYHSQHNIPNLKFHKFVYINIYTEKPEAAPRIKYVGDIIRLRRFHFKIAEKGELMGNEVKFSNWLIYDGKKMGSNVSSCYKDFPANKDRALNKYEEGRLSDLREWSDSFFFKNSLKYITWWNEYRDRTKDDKGVDLLLKCVNVDIKDKRFDFIDDERNNYSLHMEIKPNDTMLNQILKLRCVEIYVKDKRIIKLTNMSSCLLIPSYFYDYRHFETALGGKKSPGKKMSSELMERHPFLKDYDLPAAQDKKGAKGTPKKDEGHIMTAIKRAHAGKKASNLVQLKKLLEAPKKNVGEKYVFEGFVVDIENTEPKDIIKRMDTKSKQIYNINEKVKGDIKLRTFYHLVLLVKDSSGNEDDFLPVYITTNDTDNRLFDAWEILPPQEDYKSWNNLKENKLAEFSKKLKTLKKPENKVKLGLQLMITKNDKAFFKLVDTVFLP